MDLQHFIQGERVELPQMLDARERRAAAQQQILKKYGQTLVSFTLNIAGPVKVFPLSQAAYDEGVDLIRCQCRAWGIALTAEHEIRAATGCEHFFVTSAAPKTVKRVLCELEQGSSIGRLFDIDVLRPDGSKIERGELGLTARRCLLCNKEAFVCSRARAHTVDALLQRTCEMLWDYFAAKYARAVGTIASRALLYEVIATPKPGLVDKHNTGAHSDMDIFTFETSALALMPYFEQFTACGIFRCAEAPEALLPELRSLGIQAEIAMLRATGGVNTHKGIIFSLGICCAALGMLYGAHRPYDRAAVRALCRAICAPIAQDLDGITPKSAVSNGEKLFAKYGVRGVRGEAIAGFPALFEVALPEMDRLLAAGFCLNDAGVLTLLRILAETEDTNVINRSSYEEMVQLQARLKALLGGGLEKRDYLTEIEALDRELIEKHISPGGSADVLALAYFFNFFENEPGLHRAQPL